MTVAIWYPTEKAPRPFTYGQERCKSEVAPNAPVAKKHKPYPLVIFVHGGYGCGYNSAFFVEYLARHGYIVAAADYADTIPPAYEKQIAFSRMKGGNTGTPMQVLRVAGQFANDMNRSRESCFKYVREHRLPHTSAVIDEVIRLNGSPESALHQCIDESAIGICGHSLGGMTILGKIGAYPGGVFKDDRIKAALIFSAPAYPYEETLADIDVPVMVMAGDHDTPAVGPDSLRRLIYDRANPPKYYMVQKDATHFAFGNRSCGDLPLHQAVERSPKPRAICQYGLAFLDKYVRGDPSAAGRLDQTDPTWAYYVKEESPGQIQEWGKEPPADSTGGPGGIRELYREEMRKKIEQMRKRGAGEQRRDWRRRRKR